MLITLGQGTNVTNVKPTRHHNANDTANTAKINTDDATATTVPIMQTPKQMTKHL